MIRNLSWTLNPLTSSLHCLQDRIRINNHNLKPPPGIRSTLLNTFRDTTQIMSNCGKTKKSTLQFEMTWDELTRYIDVDLQSGLEIKTHTFPSQAFSEFLQNKYVDYIDIYSDGSHDPVKSTSGASFVIPKLNINFSVRLSGLMLIDSCELYAIFSAVREAVRLNLDSVLIISDSQNALNEIKYRMSNSLPHPLIKRIITEITTLIDRGGRVSLVWIPSHSGIRGTSHVCTGEHFARMGWDLPLECSCGNNFKTLKHLLKYCPLLSSQRPALNTFLAKRFPYFDFDEFDISQLIFNPDLEITTNLGKFFSCSNMILQKK